MKVSFLSFIRPLKQSQNSVGSQKSSANLTDILKCEKKSVAHNTHKNGFLCIFVLQSGKSIKSQQICLHCVVHLAGDSCVAAAQSSCWLDSNFLKLCWIMLIIYGLGFPKNIH